MIKGEVTKCVAAFREGTILRFTWWLVSWVFWRGTKRFSLCAQHYCRTLCVPSTASLSLVSIVVT